MAQRARYQPPGSKGRVKLLGLHMAIKTFKAKIVLRNGSVQEIEVQADDVFKAKELINMQYGNPKFFSQPQEVRR